MFGTLNGLFYEPGVMDKPCRAMNRDPEVYGKDAEQFNPSRHLDEKGQIKPAPADTKEESHVTYGFGKR